jgi:aryl-alcohol dehydrogenase-like predicted oxidoreductase
MSNAKDLPTRRPLGKDGPLVPRLGLGLMSNSGNYGSPASDEVRLTFLDEAHKLGETFWDTGKAAMGVLS